MSYQLDRLSRALHRPAVVVDVVKRESSRLARMAWMWKRWSSFPPDDRLGLFIFGCQRSGTTMLVDLLDCSPDVTTFGEGTNRALHSHRLRSPERITRLIRSGPAPVTAMKPICDSQLADVILDQHHGSRAVWIWRNPVDVARSAIAHWGSHQLEVMASIRSGRFDDVGWRGERIPAQTLDAICDTPLRTVWDGAVLMWFMRTSLYLSLGLDNDPRVLLIDYDALLGHPRAAVEQLFGHIGRPVPQEAHLMIRPPRQPRDDASPSEAPEELSDAVYELALGLVDEMTEAQRRHDDTRLLKSGRQ